MKFGVQTVARFTGGRKVDPTKDEEGPFRENVNLGVEAQRRSAKGENKIFSVSLSPPLPLQKQKYRKISPVMHILM